MPLSSPPHPYDHTLPKPDDDDRVVCTTLGMFIIDEFHFAPPLPAVPDQIGGGGTYVISAARMFLEASEIGMIVDRGSDWQDAWQRGLDSYGRCWTYRDDASRLTTKARATYNGETRGFEYLTPKRRISPSDLRPTRLRAPHYLHFVCAPKRALEIIREVDDYGWTDLTQLVYEPIPDMCIPSEMPALRKVLPRVHYFSPNHEEAGTFYGRPLEDVGGWKAVDKQATIEELAQRFLDEGAHNNVIIRSGKMGAFVKQRKGNARTEKGVWVPAYYQSAEKVVDVTGAGNAFLGGLMAGAHLTKGDLEQACLYGSVASSYVIEQYGLPTLGSDNVWNSCDTPADRLIAIRRRYDSFIRTL